MPDIWLDVDAAITVPVNLLSLTDDTDFKSREIAIAYNEAGMDLVWNFVTSAGIITQTAVTPTTSGVYDWTNSGDGMYKIEMPASGGGSTNNDTEGYGWFTGICTGVLPWRGPLIGFRAAELNDALVDGGDNLDVNITQWLGTAAATPTTAGVPTTALSSIGLDDILSTAVGMVEIAKSILDRVVTSHTTNNTLGKIIKGISEGWVADEGSVNDAEATTTSFISDLTQSIDSFFSDATVVFITGVLKGQSRLVSNYNGTTKTFSFDEAFTSAPVNETEFIVLAQHTHTITSITADIVAALNDPTTAAIAAAVASYDMGNGRTIEEALAFLRNKWSISGGILTVYDTDDTTVLWTASVSKTAGDPVSSVDPG